MNTNVTHRDRILQVAIEQFTRIGYKNVKTTELAKEVGISKRTLYEFYCSKYELFEACIEYILNEKRKIVKKVIYDMEHDTSASFITHLRKIWQMESKSASKLSLTFFEDVKKYTPKIWSMLEEYREVEIRKHFGQIAEIGGRLGYFKPHINLDLFYQIHFTAVHNILNSNYLINNSMSAQEVINQTCEILFSGVLTPKGNIEFYESCDNN